MHGRLQATHGGSDVIKQLLHAVKSLDRHSGPTPAASRPQKPQMMKANAGEIARILTQRAEALCLELLPAGKRHGQEWVHASPRGQQLAQPQRPLSGSRAGVWADFAGDQRGDALDLVAAVRFGGDKGQALRWARGWLGLAPSAPSGGRPAAAPATRPPQAEEDEEAIARKNAACAISLGSRPSLRDTPAAVYLAGRGIDLGELALQPARCAFIPHSGAAKPGAKLRRWSRRSVTPNAATWPTHRTWHTEDGGCGWVKANVPHPKMTLGSYAGGTIRLWRGASASHWHRRQKATR